MTETPLITIYFELRDFVCTLGVIALLIGSMS